VINIGSGREHSIAQLVQLVAQVTGRELAPIANNSQDGGISRAVADISLAARLLGYVPQVQLEQGLRRMLSEDERFRRTPA
jgi:nucleoside-diphosphate-sugar epimerase